RPRKVDGRPRRLPAAVFFFTRTESGSQAASPFRTLHQPDLALDSFGKHFVALSDAGCMGLKVFALQRLGVAPRYRSQYSHEPVFQDADATDTPLVEVFPIL